MDHRNEVARKRSRICLSRDLPPGGPFGGERSEGPRRLAGAVLLFSMLALGGCAFLENIANRRAPPDQRVVLKLGQELSISRITHRTPLGASIEQYKCGDKQLMICRDWGSDFICTCEVTP